MVLSLYARGVTTGEISAHFAYMKALRLWSLSQNRVS
ncbi:hypothetical protein MOTT12_02135 [Mycobacterium intracellulare subsp. yongonense]|nr:hypothetical protein MOTT12_02135 [Mycobacterium intracellulare subsp. yongonense]ARR82906.1 hypothetical protein MOTT27_02085 [Mycobacterium intracellulare subsp. yongonense]SKV65156.1 Uncharacterised protein [Mycobacteroides abscessus subsp. abscessus]